VGFGTPVPLLVGVILILIGIGLFFLDTFKPGYKRESDTVYAVLFMGIGLLSLLIWNAGFAEALQLMVAAGTLIALMIERIQSRTANIEPLRPMGARSSRREMERPSRAYRSSYEDSPSANLRVELEEEEFMPPLDDDSGWSRRIPSAREERGSAREERGSSRGSYGSVAYVDPLEDEARPVRTSSRRSSRLYEDEGSYQDEGAYDSERSRRRPLQIGGDGLEGNVYSEESSSSGESSRRRRGSKQPTLDAASDEVMQSNARSRRRGRAKQGNSSGSDWSVNDGEYVDYKPLNSSPKHSDDEFDNSSNFDDGPRLY
jgi:hypothetical protein